MSPSVTTTVTPSQSSGLKDQVRMIVAEWNETGFADTLAALRRFPELRLDPECVRELAYQEYQQRREAGESIDLDEFCARFPGHSAIIRKFAEAHDLLAVNESFFERELAGEQPPFRWPEAGEIVGDYQVIPPLARGGLARTYLAYEEVPQRLVVLKVSPPQFAEPRTLGRLDHPNVISVFSARVVEDGKLVVAMPYLGDSTVTDWLDLAFRGPTAACSIDILARTALRHRAGEAEAPPAAAQTYEKAVIELARGIAEGLAYLHREGVQHRDLKPSNVLITWQGRPIILDFNLAVDARRGLDRIGGTLPYMAPEQIRLGLGEAGAHVDHRADIYSFGVILYQLLTGRHPFGFPERCSESGQQHMAEERARSYLTKLENARIPEMSGIDSRLATLVLDCLRVDQTQRPASAQALADQLTCLARRDPVRQRRRRRLAAAVMCALMLVAGGASYHVATRPPLHERMIIGAKADLRDGRPLDAVRKLDRILDAETVDPQAFFLRGLARLRANRIPGALTDFEQARRQDIKDNGETSAALAYCYARQGLHDGAINLGNTAEKAGLISPAVLANRAYSRALTFSNHPSVLQRSRDEFDRALVDLRNAIAIEVRFTPAYLVRALCYVRRPGSKRNPADLEQAIAEIKAAETAGAQSAALYEFGATQVMKINPFRPEHKALVIRWLNLAADLGLDPNSISADGSFKPIANDPDFVALRARAIVPKPKAPHDFLVDPLADFVP